MVFSLFLLGFAYKYGVLGFFVIMLAFGEKEQIDCRSDVGFYFELY